MDNKQWTLEQGVQNFIESAKQNIYPVDKIAYATIMNVLDMMMVSLARKYNVKLEINDEMKQSQESIEDIMKKVKDDTNE